MIGFLFQFFTRQETRYTFDRFGNYAEAAAQNSSSNEITLKNKIREAHRAPRLYITKTENSNGQTEAHAHLTAHVTTHHGVEACLTHLKASKAITYQDDMFIAHKNSLVNPFFYPPKPLQGFLP